MNEPTKPIEDMTPEELKEFRNSLPCDEMGSDGESEGVVNA